MKKLLLILPLFLLLCSNFCCQKADELAEEPAVDVEAEKQEIRDMLKKGFETENQKDVEAVMSLGFMADDIVIQAPNMPQLKGLEAARNFYTEFFKILVSIEGGPTEIIISESGDMAWDYGWNRAVYEGPDGLTEDKGKYLEVWKKIDGKWKIVAVSFSSDKPAR
jgi:ketosteroid isomerase-like protein